MNKAVWSVIMVLLVLSGSGIALAGEGSYGKDMYTAQTVLHAASAGLGGICGQEQDQNEQLRIIRAYIEPIRFLEDSTGYFFVYDYDCVCVAHATQKDIVGKDLTDHQDKKGTYVIQTLRDMAQAGGGAVEFYWPKPGVDGVYKKMGYVEPIPGTDFFIGTGVYVTDDA